MKSRATQFVPSRRMGLCDQITMWDDLVGNSSVESSYPMILQFEQKQHNQSEETSLGTIEASRNYEQGAPKPEKVQRRLAQNREAARKSRMRKKAYVQQLEKCKQRLIQLENEVDEAKRQGCSHIPYTGSMNQNIGAFESVYTRWLEEQNRHVSELRHALNSGIGDVELGVYVNNEIGHYVDLFSMKASVAKVDAFYIMYGFWITLAERLFFWIGGFRPSEILKVLLPHLEPLSEQQNLEIFNLRQSCLQAEDALSQGMEKLHQIVADTLTSSHLGDGNYFDGVSVAVEKLEVLVRFVVQADNLRHGTLQQISRILTIRQLARGLLALGDYTQRLQALSSFWSESRNHASG